MNDILVGLKNWRKKRNMDNKEFVLDVEISNLLEECAEYLRADTNYDRIDALCDISVFSINAISYDHIEGDNVLSNCRSIKDELSFKSEEDIYFIISKISHMCELKDDISHELREILLACVNSVNSLGYDYKKCMIETIKEISSREQDPKQVKEWKEKGISGKWKKNKNQDKSTLYKANYNSCNFTN